MNVDEYYQKGRYKVSKAEKVQLDRFYKRRFSSIINALEGFTYTKVLDAGCGDGELGKMLKDFKKVDVYGVDISRKGVEIAKKKGLRGKVADISKKIPYADNSFDLVFASEAIEHVMNPDVFLKEIRRVVKPGGHILITTPNLSSWLNRILFIIGLYPLFLEASTEAKVGYGKYKKFFYGMQLVGHIHVFNLNALTEILHFHKFSIKRINGNTVDFVTPRSKLLTLLYRLIDKIMSYIPSISSDLIVVAKKTK